MRLKLLLLCLLGMVCASPGWAQVYKCKRGGTIAYQDKPCPKGTQIGRITVPPPAPAARTPAASSSANAQAAPEVPGAAASGAAALTPAAAPKPSLNTPPASSTVAQLPSSNNYLCIRYDGTRYFSASQMPNRYYVTVSQMAVPPAGMKPTQPVWVTDNCKPAPLKDACDFYSAEQDRVERSKAGAAGSAQKQLEREARRLRTVSNSRCRGL